MERNETFFQTELCSSQCLTSLKIGRGICGFLFEQHQRSGSCEQISNLLCIYDVTCRGTSKTRRLVMFPCPVPDFRWAYLLTSELFRSTGGGISALNAVSHLIIFAGLFTASSDSASGSSFQSFWVFPADTDGYSDIANQRRRESSRCDEPSADLLDGQGGGACMPFGDCVWWMSVEEERSSVIGGAFHVVAHPNFLLYSKIKFHKHASKNGSR